MSEEYTSSNALSYMIDTIEFLIQNSIEYQHLLYIITYEDEKLIPTIKVQKYNSTTHQQYTTCSICLEDFHTDAIVSALNCSHMFHTSCILEWCSYKYQCPLCRTNIKDQDEDQDEDVD